MAGRRRRRGQRVHKVLVDGPTEDKMRLSVECVQEQNLKTTANIMEPKEREQNHQQQLLGMIQNLRKELSISKESNESLRVQLKKSDEELALKENEINFLRHTLFEVENKYDSAIFGVKELQVEQEKTEAKADAKDGVQITVLHQSLHAKTEDREEKMASSDCNVMKEELKNEVSQLKELLKIKEIQLNRASKRAKAHRTTLYKLDDTQRTLGESILKCCGLEDDLSRQLAERDEHHMHELSKREENFKKELSEQQAKFKQELLEKVRSLKQQLSKMEESFQKELSEKNESFLEGLSEKEENFQKELSEKEESFKTELSEQAATFKKKLLETEQNLKQLSDKEESLRKELSEKEESFQKKVSAMKEMSDICARWEKRAKQLEEEKRKLEDYFQMKGNIQHAVEVEKNEALQRLKEEHTQLQKALRKRKLKCCALQELSKQLAQRDERHMQELSEREETFRKELLQQEARFRKELSEKEDVFQSELFKKEESFQKEFSEKEEIFQKELCATRELSEICASWERRVEQLQEEKRELEDYFQTKGNSKHSVEIKKNEELQRLKEEHIQLQEALEKSKLKCCALENLGKHLAERDERYLQELSEREESFRRELSEQEARFKMKLAEKEEIFQKKLSEKEENFEKQLSAIKELSEICASCERLNFCALEELSKQLANKDERHLQELSKREKTFREELSLQEVRFKRELSQKEERLQKELSEQEESFQKKLSEREEIYQKKLSETEESFQKILSETEEIYQKKLSETEEIFQNMLSEKKEIFQNKLSEKEEIFQNKLSEKEEIFQNKLSEKDEIFQNKLSEKEEIFQNKLSEKEEIFQNKLSETEEIFQMEVSDMKKLSEMYASWERGDQQLEEEKRKLEDYLQTKENIQHSLEVKTNEDLQHLKEEHTQLQVKGAKEVDKLQDTISFGHDERSQNASSLQPEDEARCSICQSALTDPVNTPCGHTFCNNCITKLKRRKKKKKNQCPICKETIVTRKGFKSRITKLFNL